MPRDPRLGPGTPAAADTEILVEEPAAPAGPPMPPAPFEEPPPNRELWPWLLVLLGLVLAGIAAAYFATHHKNKHPRRATTPITTTTQAQTVAPLPQRKPPKAVEATVPKVTGLQAPTALKALQTAGLVGTTTGAFSDKPKNEVVDQSPAATTRVKKGSTVTLTVSKGKKSVPVPDVVGQDAAAAIETVKAAGFTANVVRVPSGRPAGQVIAQAPPAGKPAPGSSAVRLNVSDGSGGGSATTTAPATTTTPPATTQAAAPKPPPVPATVTVPDVTGLKLLAARKQIHAAGLVTGFKRVPSEEPKGTVLAQSPKPGETRKRGQHVFVTVSLGPKPQTTAGAQPTVPDVTGEDEDTARADLESAGFTVTVVDQPTNDPTEDGIVVDQNPEPGGTAAAKSQVTIYVSRYQSG